MSDFHGRSPAPLLGIPNIDLVLILGDITTGAGLTETAHIVNELRNSYERILTVPGNWERNESASWLQKEGLSIDEKPTEIEKVVFYGLGGSIPTPFHTPREFPEKHYKSILDSYPAAGKDKRLILVTHTPPFGACDRTFSGSHVGSNALREFIVSSQPDLVFCGHIHEAKGKMSLGKTLVVNPGPAPSNYAVVDIDIGISVDMRG